MSTWRTSATRGRKWPAGVVRSSLLVSLLVLALGSLVDPAGQRRPLQRPHGVDGTPRMIRRALGRLADAAILRSTFWRPRWLYIANVWLYRRTGGRIGGRVRGMPVLLLTTIGRRSGQPRTTPLLYLAYGEDLVVVNSDADAPDWWRNIQHRPEVSVQVGAQTITARGYAPDAQERARLWASVSARSPLWRRHQEETGQEPLIVVLRPIRPIRQPRGFEGVTWSNCRS